MLELEVNEAWNTFVSEQGKPDAIILAGSNPKRPVNGEACKALLPEKEHFLGFYVVESFVNSGLFDNIYVVGPERRLRTAFEDTKLQPDIDFILYNERNPGPIKQAVENVRRLTKDYFISDFVGVASSDIPDITPEAVIQVFNDIANRYVNDTEKADWYFTLGDVNEDVKHYTKLNNDERPGMLIEKKDILRTGNVHLVNQKEVLDNDMIADFLELRKIKTELFRPTIYKMAGQYAGFEGIFEIAKALYNREKMAGSRLVQTITRPLPYFNQSLSRFEEVFRRTGVRVNLVPTLCSADIDNDVEYKAHQEYSNSGVVGLQ